MKSICVNSSANLPQVFEISTKTKFAYCVKNSLPMFLLMPLVLAWPRPTYEINGGSTLWISSTFGCQQNYMLLPRTICSTLSLWIIFLLYAQLQTSEQHRSSIQQSDTSYLIKHCDRYITIYLIFILFHTPLRREIKNEWMD